MKRVLSGRSKAGHEHLLKTGERRERPVYVCSVLHKFLRFFYREGGSSILGNPLGAEKFTRLAVCSPALFPPWRG